MISRLQKGLVGLLLAWCATSAAFASSGTVIDPQGRLLEGVRVCYVAGEVEQLCVTTEEDGAWKLPNSGIDTVRLSLAGFLPKKISSLPRAEAVILSPAATLVIKFEGPNGKPLAGGEAEIVRPSGLQVGPFPVSREAGTRIRSLEPGPVVILGRSDGFDPASSTQTELVAGEETTIVIRFKR